MTAVALLIIAGSLMLIYAGITNANIGAELRKALSGQ